MKPGEVAARFRVDPKTVTRGGKAGKLTRTRTPGGHNRFRESEVRAKLEEDGIEGIDGLIARVLRTSAAR